MGGWAFDWCVRCKENPNGNAQFPMELTGDVG